MYCIVLPFKHIHALVRGQVSALHLPVVLPAWPPDSIKLIAGLSLSLILSLWL